MTKRIVFITGTRADYGKIKSILKVLDQEPSIDVHIFVTGMHMFKQYGETRIEVEKDKFKNIYSFINHSISDGMDTILGKTIIGFGDYIKETEPDLIIVHGDRVEALAGATVGALNNIRVVHIEGGEVSGTIDESIRHAISKMAHYHFVANERAKQRLLKMGETDKSISISGSPDIDIMLSPNLPSIDETKTYYGIEFEQYAIALFHPVTTETQRLEADCESFVQALIESDCHYIVVFPNNDHGRDTIFRYYDRFKENPKFKIFPSIRFEFFLTLMKQAQFMIGNSSAGVREAPCYGVPSINIGSRQLNRAVASSIINVEADKNDILQAIKSLEGQSFEPIHEFGTGDSTERVVNVLLGEEIWHCDVQKVFED